MGRDVNSQISITSTTTTCEDEDSTTKNENVAAEPKLETNLSAVLHGPHNLQMENLPLPVLEPNDVVISVQATGICGSDMHYYAEGRCGRFRVQQPMVLGHESSGLVIAIGPQVRTLRAGDRVAIEPGVPSRYSAEYKAGRYNLCKQMQFCAAPPINGTLTQYFVHPEDFCHKLSSHVSYEEGALMEPLAVAIHACRRASIGAGSKVLITGAGPVGMLCGMVAKAMGAIRVGITDKNPARLDFALSIKCVDTVFCVASSENPPVATVNVDPLLALLPEQELSHKVNAVLFGEDEEPDCTLECSGALASVRLGIFATRAGGAIALVGRGPMENSLPLPIAASKEIDIRGIFRYVNCYPTALQLIASKQVDVKPLVTHRFELAQTKEAFDFALSPTDTGAIKIIIQGIHS